MELSEKTNYLARVGIFSGLPEESLRQIAGLMESREIASGETFIQAGEFGDTLYFICRGEAEVFSINRKGARIVIRQLKAGDWVGEMALLTGAPRSASVKVLQDALVLVLYKGDFDNILHGNTHLAVTFSRLLAEKLLGTTRLYQDVIDKEEELTQILYREEEKHLARMAGKSRQFKKVEKRIEVLAGRDEWLTVTGPEGGALEDVARLIHMKSSRKAGPYLILDLGGGEEWLTCQRRFSTGSADGSESSVTFEEFQISSLFGHVTGAFEKADVTRMGYLELADGGTLVLKNVGRLTPGARKRFIHYILKGYFYPLGSTAAKTSDCRIIATTSRSDEGESLPGISGILSNALLKIIVDLPPLSQRSGDIPMIARSYLEKHSFLRGKEISQISPEAMNMLVRYHWPGNEHELEYVIERGVLLCDGDTFTAEHIFLGLSLYTEKGRLPLLKYRFLRKAFSHLGGRHLIQGFLILVLTTALLLSLLGNQNPLENLGSSLVWYYWWPFLLVSFLIMGRFYCSVCPIKGLTKLTRKFGSFDLPVPRLFQRIGVSAAAVVGIGLFWLEEIYQAKWTPARAALLISAIVLAAVVVNVIFRQEMWCRYLCPMGFFSGICSCLSATELRVDGSVCTAQCKTVDCYQGSGANDMCPMDLHPASLQSNQHCKMCGICAVVCPYNAVHFDLRWPGAEIWENREQDLVTAMAIPSLLAILIPLFLREGHSPFFKDWLSFTLLFAGCLAASLLIFTLASLPGGRETAKRTLRKNLSIYGFAYLPLTYAGYLAFQLPYLLAGIYQLFSYPPTADFHTMVNPWSQRLIILAGTAWSLWVVHRVSDEGYKGPFILHTGVVLLFGLSLLLVLHM